MAYFVIAMRMNIQRCLQLFGLLAGLYCAHLQAAPVQLSLLDLNGKIHTLDDYKGKWVVVNYWATWCPPCLDEIPELIEFHDKYKDKDAVVLGINHEAVKLDDLKEFVEQYFISYPVLRGQPGSQTPFGTLRGLPTTYLVSPTGEVVARKTGRVSLQDLEDSIEYFKQESTGSLTARR